MNKIIRTKVVLEKFNISRQTLYNWIKSEEITPPELDWRGWRKWTELQLEEINELINRRNEINKKAYINNNGFDINNRRYLGSKYKLLGFIEDVVNENCRGIETVSDIFAGTGSVAYNFNKNGKKVIVNDILLSNYTSYQTWFSDQEVNMKKLSKIINELNNLSSINENYVSENFGGKYFSYDNSLKIGAIREEIERLTEIVNTREKSILLTSLMYAVDKCANTCGHYDAYRRKLDALEPIELLLPRQILIKENIHNEIYRKDANQLVKELNVDLTYIDTPYNSRQYGDAYHLLENIIEWKKPKVEGVAKKMINRSNIKSAYCTVKAPQMFEDLISNINSRYILVSYNNMAQKGVGRSNAKISNEEIIESLSKVGKVKIFDTDYKIFTTGKTSIQGHKELLYLCERK